MNRRIIVSSLLMTALFTFFNLSTGFNFANQFSTLKFTGANSKLILETPLTLDEGTLSLRDETSGSVTGNDITFVDGVLHINSDKMSTAMTGKYTATTSESIELSGNDTLDMQAGTISVPINVSGTNNLIEGRVLLANTITLTDAATELKIAVHTQLSQNVNLTGGKLILKADLKLADGVSIVGPGTIEFEGNELKYGVGVTTYTTNLDFTGEVNINLSSDISLNSCTWNFPETGGFSIINGNGNSIDLTSSGILNIGENHTLFLNNVTIKGLGDGVGEGKIIYFDDDSILAFRDSTIEIINDYTVSEGQFFAQGANSIIKARAFDITFSGGALLTVDGVALIWDRMSFNNDSSPIIPDAPANQSLINDGYIRSIDSILQPQIILDDSFSLSGNIYITTASNFIFDNATPLTPKVTNFDGNGNFIQFSKNTATANLIVEDNITLTMSNVVLKDFNPDSVVLGTASTINFGDGVLIELCQDTDLTSPLSLVGNVTINGQGFRLSLSHDDSLVISVNNKTLTLINMSLHGLGGASTGSGIGRLRMDHPGDKIVFQNVHAFMDESFFMPEGAMEFEGIVKFSGKNRIFNYTSPAQSVVAAESLLYFDTGVTFSYAPDSTILVDPASRNRLMLSDTTSAICLDGATIHSTHTGIMLDTGKLIIKDHCKMRSVAGINEGPYTGVSHDIPATGEEPVLKSSLNIRIEAGAVFDVLGTVVYE